MAQPQDLSLRAALQATERELRRNVKQLAVIAPVWEQLVPPQLLACTRLDGFSRGVLRVAVQSSSQLHQLDILLRRGLATQLITQCRGVALRRVQLRLAPLT